MKRNTASLRGVLLILLLIGLVPASTVLAQPMDIYTTKNSYLPGEPIVVAYRGVPGTGGDWATIVKAGAPANEPGQWIYIDEGNTTGTLTFDGMTPGRYEVRLYLNWPTGGYNIAARQAFSVLPGLDAGPSYGREYGITERPIRPAVQPIVVYTQKQTYYPFEPITVNYQDLPGNKGDWLTIVPAGARDDNPGQWRYTDGNRSGTVTFFGFPPGSYEVRVYLDWPSGGYNIAARHGFWVQ